MTTNTKTPFDRSKRFKPTPDNRQEAVDRIIWGINDLALDKREENELIKLVACVRQDSFDDPYYEMSEFSLWLGVKSCSQILQRDVDGWNTFTEVLSYSFYGQLNDRHARLAEDATYADPMGGGR